MNERIIVGIRSHLKFRNYHVKFRPQFDDPEMLRPGANLPFCPSSYAIGPHWRHTALNCVSRVRGSPLRRLLVPTVFLVDSAMTPMDVTVIASAPEKF